MSTGRTVWLVRNKCSYPGNHMSVKHERGYLFATSTSIASTVSAVVTWVTALLQCSLNVHYALLSCLWPVLETLQGVSNVWLIVDDGESFRGRRSTSRRRCFSVHWWCDKQADPGARYLYCRRHLSLIEKQGGWRSISSLFSSTSSDDSLEGGVGAERSLLTLMFLFETWIMEKCLKERRHSQRK